MNNYIDFGRLPITESELTDTLFGIREDGELIRCNYYIKPQIDEMIETTQTTAAVNLSAVQEQLSNQIKQIKKDTVDMLGEAVINLSKI